MKTYRMLIEYWVPDEDENLYEEKIIQSRYSCGKIADDYLAQDRTNLIRSVEVTPRLNDATLHSICLQDRRCS